MIYVKSFTIIEWNYKEDLYKLLIEYKYLDIFILNAKTYLRFYILNFRKYSQNDLISNLLLK